MPRKKQFQILQQGTQGKMKSINIDGHEIKMRKRGITHIEDAGLAREIDQRLGYKARTAMGGKVIVSEVDHQDPNEERGFTMSHRVPDLSNFKGWAEAHAKKKE